MKKIRGFVDPISLGFLIIIMGVGAAATHSKKVEKDQVSQNSQTPIVQVAQQTRR